MAWSSKKKRGRPKVTTAKWDYGNDRVQARVAMFRHFKGDSAIGHEMTCAGRLMLVGAFDGLDHPAETLLAALLAYSDAYWSHYSATAPKVAAYERQDRSQDHRWEDPKGERFAAMDDRLCSAGRQARMAVQAVTTDRHWFPDEDSSWAARIINSRFLDRRLPVCGELACDSDWQMLELLRQGALALVGQTRRMAA